MVPESLLQYITKNNNIKLHIQIQNNNNTNNNNNQISPNTPNTPNTPHTPHTPKIINKYIHYENI